MADCMASLGLFQKIAINSRIRFGPITVMWNREHASATLMDFVGLLGGYAPGLGTLVGACAGVLWTTPEAIAHVNRLGLRTSQTTF